MSDWVTGVMCAVFLLLFVGVGYWLVSDWIKAAKWYGGFSRSMYREYKVDKQAWEKQEGSQQPKTQNPTPEVQTPKSETQNPKPKI